MRGPGWVPASRVVALGRGDVLRAVGRGGVDRERLGALAAQPRRLGHRADDLLARVAVVEGLADGASIVDGAGRAGRGDAIGLQLGKKSVIDRGGARGAGEAERG